MTKSQLFTKAHEIARTLEGDYSARFSMALSQTWKQFKGADKMVKITEIDFLKDWESFSGKKSKAKKSFVEVLGEQVQQFYKVNAYYESTHILTHYYINESDAIQCANKWKNKECEVYQEIILTDGVMNIPCADAFSHEGKQILTDRYLNSNKIVDWNVNNVKFFEHN